MLFMLSKILTHKMVCKGLTRLNYLIFIADIKHKSSMANVVLSAEPVYL